MTQQLAAPEITYDEFLQLHEEADEQGLGRGYELDEGELILMPALDPSQSRILAELIRQIGNHVVPSELGQLYPDCFMDLGRRRWYYPDLSYLDQDDLQRFDGRRVPTGTALLIEISIRRSEERDAVRKKDVYHRAGVRWYWILNMVRETIEEYRHEPDGYLLVSRGGLYEPFQPLLFPGLTIHLTGLIPRAS